MLAVVCQANFLISWEIQDFLKEGYGQRFCLFPRKRRDEIRSRLDSAGTSYLYRHRRSSGGQLRQSGSHAAGGADDHVTAARSLRAIPVNLDIMGGPAAGDDVAAAIAVEVRSQGILARHAAVVDGNERGVGARCAALDVEEKDAGAPRTRGVRWVRI